MGSGKMHSVIIWAASRFVACKVHTHRSALWNGTNQLFAKRLQCPVSDRHSLAAIASFALPGTDEWSTQTQKLSYQPHAAELKLRQETVIIGRVSAVAILC